MSVQLPTNLDNTKATNHLRQVPAEKQITSSQILHDAHEYRLNIISRPAQQIKDLDELRLFQLTKRRNYEQQLNKNRLNYGQWMRYAKWEIESNHDFKRGRSILERALEVNVQHVPFWVRYIELELQHKNVNHARNLLNRAVSTLPRSEKFWFIYVQIEESLANFKSVREIFERWLMWRPMRGAWEAYAAFEVRYNEPNKARAIYLRYTTEYKDAEAWLKWVSFEMDLSSDSAEQIALTRGVYEAGADAILNEERISRQKSQVCEYFARWIQWEDSVQETERAKAIFSKLIEDEYLLKEQKVTLVENFKIVEVNVGIDPAKKSLTLKRKLQYEQNVTRDPHDYDSWWELAKIKEASELTLSAAAVLRSAVSIKPADAMKLILWRRYVFLWIKLALLLEFELKEPAQARETWKNALATVPHELFSFAKLWIMYAEFDLRTAKCLHKARKVLGRAIGQGCQSKPKRKIFGYYISFEKRLSAYDRVRKIYDKWVEVAVLYDKSTGSSASTEAIQEYIQFEKSLFESERCIQLFKIGLDEQFGNAGLLLPKFVDFLKEEFRYEEARSLIKDRIRKSEEPHLWIMLALFESSILSPAQVEQLEVLKSNEAHFKIDDHHITQSRSVFEDAYNHFKKEGNGDAAVEILDAWKVYESTHGLEEILRKIESKRPQLITKRKDVDGVVEEYYEYEFPGPKIDKFLANALKWAQSA